MNKGITEEHIDYRRYTAEECFLPPTKMVCGFDQKNFKARLHFHMFYEINIVTRGSANHYIGQRKIKVRTGDVFIVPPNVIHGYDGDESVDVYHILLNPKFLEKHSAELQCLSAFSALFKIDPLMREKTSAKLHFRLTEKEINMLKPHLDFLLLYSKKSEVADIIISSAQALIIIAELCRIYDRHSEISYTYDKEDTAFLSSIARIYEGYANKLTVVELASIARMSRNAYIAKFKRITGQTPAKFLRNHRVDMAKQLLMETALTEEEIATSVGFTDTSHLIKVFSAELGVTPSAYKKRVQ